jgi:hypothetical protein
MEVLRGLCAKQRGRGWVSGGWAMGNNLKAGWVWSGFLWNLKRKIVFGRNLRKDWKRKI